MKVTTFSDLLKVPATPQNTVDASQWIAEQVQLAASPDKIIRTGGDRLVTKITIGRMYLFSYDPKTKEKLPYYDTFPLVFPFSRAEGGFYGINMHYLPHMLRAKLMDALLLTANNSKFDDSTKLKISYNILNNASKYRYFKPCVKHYLNNHVQSRFLWIPSDQWNKALFLPLERFVGASTNRVHRESRQSISLR